MHAADDFTTYSHPRYFILLLSTSVQFYIITPLYVQCILQPCVFLLLYMLYVDCTRDKSEMTSIKTDINLMQKWNKKCHKPVHDSQHLFPYILSSFECAYLNKVFITPCIGELVIFPSIVHCQQCEVITLCLVELGLLLVCKCLLLL